MKISLQVGGCMSLENKLLRAINSNNPNKIESVFEEIYYEYGKNITNKKFA